MLIEHEILLKPRLAHGFFTRMGGVSVGPYASLNCAWTNKLGPADAPENILENRRRVARRLRVPVENLLTARQVHSATALLIHEPFAPAKRPEADALVTTQIGIALGVLTADCAPVLLADVENGVIGAAHAGWRGAFDGVLAATVNLMLNCGAQREQMVAVVGPCIQQNSYEVGAEFHARFMAEHVGLDRFFLEAKRDGYFMFDLSGFVLHRLRQAGITQVQALPQDTLREEAGFFSYRRSTLRAESQYGGQISAIALLA